jgi:hypothetical protein
MDWIRRCAILLPGKIAHQVPLPTQVAGFPSEEVRSFCNALDV